MAPDPSVPNEMEISAEIYALLSQANLLRVRGRWNEAIDLCTDAMRLAPDNVSVQSLLGDIYENQGCIDDAIQWYRMALDRNPNSRADQLKLAHLLDLKSQNMPADFSHELTAKHPANIPTLLIKTDTNKALRIATYASALLVCAVILLSIGISHRSAGAGRDHAFQTAPVMLAGGAGIPSASDGTTSILRDPSEQTLLQSLQTAPELANVSGTIVDVQSDPRDASVTISVVFRPAPTQPVQRDAILRLSLRVLQATRDRTETTPISVMTVRCLLAANSANSASAPMIFTADMARNDIPASAIDISTLAPEQLLTLFSNVWWSPAMPT